MSVLDIVLCDEQITVNVLDEAAIDLVDFYDRPPLDLLDGFAGQALALDVCTDVLEATFIDPAAPGFLSIRDRANDLIYDRFSAHVNMR